MTLGMLRNLFIGLLAGLVLLTPHHFSHAAAGPDPSTRLTDAEIEKLMGIMEQHGQVPQLNPQVTAALGLTKGDEVLQVRQLSVGDPAGIGHAFHKLPDGGYLLASVDSEAARIYRLDPKLNLVVGVLKKSDQGPVTIPPTEAAKAIESEFKIWAEVVKALAP